LHNDGALQALKEERCIIKIHENTFHPTYSNLRSSALAAVASTTKPGLVAFQSIARQSLLDLFVNKSRLVFLLEDIGENIFLSRETQSH
jgi:hypothetical protein